MAFYKILSVLIIAISLFSSNGFSMNEDDLLDSKDSNYSSIPTPIKADVEKKECCSHWGLSHWFAGIGEYFQRCICCTSPSKEGNYKWSWAIEDKRTGPNNGSISKAESDCALLIFGGGRHDSCCNNPFIGTLCCPIVSVTHLCCLPCACCDYSENKKLFRQPMYDPIPSVYVPGVTNNPLSHHNCTSYVCFAREGESCIRKVSTKESTYKGSSDKDDERKREDLAGNLWAKSQEDERRRAADRQATERETANRQKQEQQWRDYRTRGGWS